MGDTVGLRAWNRRKRLEGRDYEDSNQVHVVNGVLA